MTTIIIGHVKLGLKIIGVWPGGYSGFIGFFLFVGYISLNVPFMIWQMVVANFEVLMALMGVLMAVSSGILKVIAFRIRGRDITYAVNEILKDWASENELKDAELMKKNLKRGNYLTKWLIGFYNGVVVTYGISAIVNYSSGIVETRSFVMPAKFPAAWKQSPVYEVVCLIQFTVTLLNTNGNAMMEGLLSILVLHANTKANIIRRELAKFVEVRRTDDNEKLASETMKSVVKKHLNFIEFVEKTREIFIYVSAYQVFIFTLLHVIVAFELLEALEKGESPMKIFLYGLFTTRALLSTSIYCIAGEYLMNQSENIYADLYECPWYELSTSNKKALCFILMKAYKPTCLTPAFFGDLSLNYLSGVIRTSYSFLSLVRATR